MEQIAINIDISTFSLLHLLKIHGTKRGTGTKLSFNETTLGLVIVLSKIVVIIIRC